MDKKYGILIICAAILVLCFVGTASAKTWYVDDDGGADFTRIQDAIYNATDGDIIIVKEGNYTENIKVDKHLTIQSKNGTDKTIVRAEDLGDSIFNVTVDYVNISGFTVECATWYGTAGICLYYADYCDVSDNNCKGYGYDPFHIPYGILLSGSNNNSISNNNCSNNKDGISLRGSNNNSISNNNCSLNGACGITLHDSNNNSVSNNNCSLNGAFSMYLIPIEPPFLGDGIRLGASNNNIISNNSCSNNEDNGIHLWRPSSNNIIFNNNCLNNSCYGIILAYSRNNLIYLNNFIDNTDNVHSYSTNTWNSKEKINYTCNEKTYENYLGNYWGDYEEKYPDAEEIDATGILDTPYSIDGDKDNYPLMEPFENYPLDIVSHNVSVTEQYIEFEENVFSFEIPELWEQMTESELTPFRQQFEEQTRQLARQYPYTRPEDFKGILYLAGFSAPRQEALLVASVIQIPPQAEDYLDQMYESSKEKIQWGIEQGMVREAFSNRKTEINGIPVLEVDMEMADGSRMITYCFYFSDYPDHPPFVELKQLALLLPQNSQFL